MSQQPRAPRAPAPPLAEEAPWFAFSGEPRLVTDADGIILQINPAAAQLLGARGEVILGKPLPLLVCESRQQAFYHLLMQLRRAGGGTREWPARLRVGRGTPLDVLLGATSLVGEDDRVSSIHWSIHESGLLASAWRALRAERDLADGLLNHTRALVILLGPEGRVLRANPYVEEVTGHNVEELIGQPWEALLPLKAQPAARRALAVTLHQGSPMHYTGEALGRDGKNLWVSWTALALTDSESGLRSALVIGQDVTELHQAQQKASQSERLAAIGQVVTGLTQEARNLLQRGRSALGLLAFRLEQQPDLLGFVEQVDKAFHELSRLFEDVRSFAAPLQLEREWVDLSLLWHEAWANVREAFPDREAQLHDHRPQGRSLQYQGDRMRLRQVFRILLENTFESCSGPVCVEVHCDERMEGERRVLRLVFRDNGPGFTPEQRRKAADPFYTSKAHGTGLGLTLAKRIAEAHGGSLTIADRGPPGADILVTLPRS